MCRAAGALGPLPFAQRGAKRVRPRAELLHGRREGRSLRRPRDSSDRRLQPLLRQRRRGASCHRRRRGHRRRFRDAPHRGQCLPEQRGQPPAPRLRRPGRAPDGRQPARRDVRIRYVRRVSRERVDPRGGGDAVENVVRAEFFDSRFIRDSPDTPFEITIIGGDANASDDHASVLITSATVETSDGVPVEGGLSIEDETGSGEVPSTARLQGSRSHFLVVNQGLPAPEDHFFIGH